MKTRLLLVLLLVVNFISCKTDKEGKNEENQNSITEKTAEKDTAQFTSKGYELMTQKCFICHFEKPDPSRRSQMLAPPFLRVQEHYKPTYPKKEEFVTAVMAIVNNPSEKNTLMPGAIRKFNLMPKLVYDQEELRLIAGELYDIDFGSAPKMRMKQGLQLDKGKKWKLTDKSMEQINSIVKNLDNFKATEISAFNQLGKDVFNEAKLIMLDDSYEGELWNQVHNFFASIENNMHILMATQSLDVANNELTILKVKFGEFYNYFE